MSVLFAVRGLAGRPGQPSVRAAAAAALAVTSSRGLKNYRLPTDEELATGLEKRELMALKAGNKDPFDMEGHVRGPGTKDQPNIVRSMLDKRMIGCICEEDSSHIVYMWLHKGEPKRCECGHWFKLVEGKFI